MSFVVFDHVVQFVYVGGGGGTHLCGTFTTAREGMVKIVNAFRGRPLRVTDADGDGRRSSVSGHSRTHTYTDTHIHIHTHKQTPRIRSSPRCTTVS